MRHLKAAAILGAAAGGALLFSSQAMAAPTTIDGITFEPGSIIQTAQLFETVASNPGDELSGFGQVTTINGNTNFCASGACELTFSFNGYTVDQETSGHASFTGGLVQFFADDSPDFDASNAASAVDGQLFLSAAGHTFLDQTSGLTGTLIASGTNLTTNQPSGNGTGYLDVTGGDAATFFDTDTFTDFMGGTTDIQFNSSFSTSDCASTTDFPVCGSADVHSGTGGGGVSVPEPSALGLMGLGLIGLGFATRRRRRRG